MDIQSVFWLALLVVLLVIELATLGLTTIWFAGGSLAAFLVSLFYDQLAVEIVVFAAVSAVLLIFTRPFAVKYINRNRVKTNTDSLIGQTAVVTEAVDNLAGTGQAAIAGQTWTARAKEDGIKIQEGSVVTVLKISGVKLIVEPIEALSSASPKA